MPLNTPLLKTDILQILEDLSKQTDHADQARNAFADKLSKAIEKYVKAGTVAVTVQTAGTATAHTGTGTGSMT